MHFVKKVPTTEEQKAKKEKERAIKLKIYCKLRDEIFEKRKKGELDEEMLSLTGNLLERNPDIYTFWNIRRQVIDLLSKKLPEESDEENIKRKDSMLHAEMLLTKVCLKCFKQLSKPNIAEELTACAEFLQLDGRNFHCWDYRREVAKFGAQSANEELKFSDQLINTNFSNYSSWHYRSSLLPCLFPEPEKQLIVEQQALHNEYQKLENAFFTDPEDQSAWIYAEWLLLSDPKKRKYTIDDVHLLGLIFDCISEEGNERAPVTHLLVTFDRAIKLTKISDFLILKLESGEYWTPTTDAKMTNRGAVCASNSYQFEIIDKLAECQLRPSLNDPYAVIDIKKGYVNFDEIYHFYHVKRKPVNEARRQSIEKLMDNCKELLNELESEQKKEIFKWPLFTYTLAMIELNPIEMYETILTNLKELSTNIDPQRCEMYREMATNLKINERLRQKMDGLQLIDTLFRPINDCFIGELKLDNLRLRNIDHLKYLSPFITHLDLTGNKFTNLCSFKSFRRLTHLNLDKNPIASLEGISLLPRLDYLCVRQLSTDNLNSNDEIARKRIKTLKFSDVYCEDHSEHSE